MTQPDKSAHNRPNQRTQSLTNRRFASTLPAQSLGWLSSVSLLSGGLVLAQTESSVDNIVPTVESSQPKSAAEPVKIATPTPTVESSQPDFVERRARLQKKLHTEKVSQSQPKPEKSQPAVILKTSQPQVEKSRVKKAETPVRSESEKPAKVAQPAKNFQNSNSTTAQKKKDYNNAYIDPTDYQGNATGNYEAPSSVVVTERATGCEAIFSKREIAAGACGRKATDTPRVADAPKKSATNSKVATTQTSSQGETVVQAVAAAVNNNQSWRTSQPDTRSHTKTAYRPNRFIPQPSDFSATTTVSATPIAPSFGSLPAPMSEDKVAPRPSNVSYDFALASVLPQIPYSNAFAYRGGSTGVAYPLSFAAPITSLFGWRIHPITGDRRFHAGTDIGAPTGTPILAAAKGQVETADWMGGYGLTVTVNHSSAQQTLYAHMSEILVRPGQWVEPGTLIGRVGSTGNSTGPHLHFEVRHLTPNGWVAVDPGVKLQAGLNNLVYNNRTAQAQ
jgi:murein DD-endopeptidase MepM/ murein hydrolase activator NlpD